MPKLVRLIGDSTLNNSEIKNNLADNMIVKANSRISCISANATILSEVDQEEYVITYSETYSYGPNAKNVSELTVVIPANVYSGVNALLRAMQISANSVGEDNSAWEGIHNRWYQDNGKCKLEVYKASFSASDFETEWEIIDGEDAITLASNSFTSDGSEEVQMIADGIVPLSSNKFRGNVKAVGPFRLSAMAFGDTVASWGISLEMESGNLRYSLLYRESDDTEGKITDLTYTPAIGDQFRIEKYGNTIRLIVYTGNTNPPTLAFPIITQVLTQNVLNDQSMLYTIEIPVASVIDLEKCFYTAIGEIDPSLVSETDHTDMLLTFSSSLRSYLGFTDLIYAFDGDPASLLASNYPKGLSKYPGIMIAIRGLDLESYAGSVGKNSSDKSFLGVTRLKENFTLLDYEPNNPTMLKMKNKFDINFKSLSVSFIQDNTIQRPLEFYGYPVVVLEIHGPDE